MEAWAMPTVKERGKSPRKILKRNNGELEANQKNKMQAKLGSRASNPGRMIFLRVKDI